MKMVGTWRAMSALTIMFNTLYNQYLGILTWHAMSLPSNHKFTLTHIFHKHCV